MPTAIGIPKSKIPTAEDITKIQSNEEDILKIEDNQDKRTNQQQQAEQESLFMFMDQLGITNGSLETATISGAKLEMQIFSSPVTATALLMKVIIEAVRQVIDTKQQFDQAKLTAETQSSKIQTDQAKESTRRTAEEIHKAQMDSANCDVIMSVILIVVSIVLAAFTAGAALALSVAAIAAMAVKLGMDIAAAEAISRGDYEGAAKLKEAGNIAGFVSMALGAAAAGPALASVAGKTLAKGIAFASKFTMKQMIKKAVVTATKESIKDGSKAVTKEAIKEATEQAAKKAMTSIVKKFAKEGGEQGAQTVKEQIKAVLQKIFTKDILKNVVKGAKNVGNKIRKTASDLYSMGSDAEKAAQSAAKESLKKSAAEGVSATTKSTRVTAKSAEKVADKYVSKALSKAYKEAKQTFKLNQGEKTAMVQNVVQTGAGIGYEYNRRMYETTMADTGYENDKYNILIKLMEQALQFIMQTSENVDEETKKLLKNYQNALQTKASNFAQVTEGLNSLAASLSPTGGG